MRLTYRFRDYYLEKSECEGGAMYYTATYATLVVSADPLDMELSNAAESLQ